MYEINDLMFVFYWRSDPKDEWLVSQPVTLGELIDGGVEFSFPDESSLPLNDVEWGRDQIRVVPVPSRKYAPSEDSDRSEG